MTAHAPEALAARLLLARGEGPPVMSTDWSITDRAMAHAVQDETLRILGPVGGWKVGAKSASDEPTCAPLPARGLVRSGTTLHGPTWRLRGIELEVAVRIGRDVQASDLEHPQGIVACIDAVLPAIEVVESRLADWREADPLEQLADLQSHGALVLGEPRPWPAGGVNLKEVQALLSFDGRRVADARGANAAGDLVRLLAWLARHAQGRHMPLRAGTIVTTGSCSGFLPAGEAVLVEGEIPGLGPVSVRF